MKIGNWVVSIEDYIDEDGRRVTEMILENLRTGVRITVNDVEDNFVSFETYRDSGYIDFDNSIVSVRDKYTGEVRDIPLC